MTKKLPLFLLAALMAGIPGTTWALDVPNLQDARRQAQQYCHVDCHPDWIECELKVQQRCVNCPSITFAGSAPTDDGDEICFFSGTVNCRNGRIDSITYNETTCISIFFGTLGLPLF